MISKQYYIYMKKLIWLISISFVFINIFGVLLYFSFNPNFYIKHFNTEQITDFRLSDFKSTYSFLQNKSELNNHFTVLEKSHLQDVKEIFSVVYYIFWISIILFFISSLFLIYIRKYSLIFKWLFIWSIISLSIMLIAILAITIDFTFIFQSFHKLFFPQWNREFAENSRLITLFPETFFRSIIYKIFSNIFWISMIIIWLFLITKKLPYRKT